MDAKAANAKVEANALIAKGYIESAKCLTQAKNLLLEAEVPADEIIAFMKDRKLAAKIISKRYFGLDL